MFCRHGWVTLASQHDLHTAFYALPSVKAGAMCALHPGPARTEKTTKDGLLTLVGKGDGPFCICPLTLNSFPSKPSSLSVYLRYQVKFQIEAPHTIMGICNQIHGPILCLVGHVVHMSIAFLCHKCSIFLFLVLCFIFTSAVCMHALFTVKSGYIKLEEDRKIIQYVTTSIYKKWH